MNNDANNNDSDNTDNINDTNNDTNMFLGVARREEEALQDHRVAVRGGRRPLTNTKRTYNLEYIYIYISVKILKRLSENYIL